MSDDKPQDGRDRGVDTVSKGYAKTLRRDAKNERKLRQAAEKELADFKAERAEKSKAK